MFFEVSCLLLFDLVKSNLLKYRLIKLIIRHSTHYRQGVFIPSKS
jgi:hypothetical protein